MVLKDSLGKLRDKQSLLLVGNAGQLTARDAMIKPVFVYEDDDASMIIKKLKREDTNVCIVITKEKTFVGEISDEDLIKLFLHQAKYEPLAKRMNTGYRREFLHKSAKQLVNKHKSTVMPETPINKVIELVYKEGFQYIPVVDKGKKVIGVVTPSSIIDLLEDH
jgi:CBS-domain-containing membrane protein